MKRKRITLLTLTPLLLFLLALTSVSFASGGGIIVTTTDPAIAADGQCSLNEAIENANDDAATHADCNAGIGDDLITLQASASYTFTEYHNDLDGPTALPVITDKLTIEGNNATIARSTSASTPDFRLMKVGTNGDLTLQNVTLMHGSAVSATVDPDADLGAAILSFGTLTILDSDIAHNSGEAGAIFNAYSNLTIVGSTLRHNVAGDSGAAVFSIKGQVEIHDSSFEMNEAGNDAAALLNSSGNVTITNSTFDGNIAADGAGAISNEANSDQQDGTMLIQGSHFINNQSLDNQGGAVRNIGGEGRTATLTIEDSQFINNSASGSDVQKALGGALANQAFVNTENVDLIIYVSNTLFEGNSAKNGGAIANADIETTPGVNYEIHVVGSTFKGNAVSGTGLQAGNGGAIINVNQTLYVANSTFSGNEANGTGVLSGLGGAVANGAVGNPSDVTLINNTFSGNSANSGGAAVTNNALGGVATINAANNLFDDGATACEGAVTSQGHNLDAGISCAFSQPGDLSNATANLGPLADNGGATPTMALLAGSDAIDAGDNAVCAADPVNGVDQRGVARPQGAGCDIGAFEADTASPVNSISYIYFMSNQTSGNGQYDLFGDGSFADEDGNVGVWQSNPASGSILLSYSDGSNCSALSIGRFSEANRFVGYRLCRDGSGVNGLWVGFLPDAGGLMLAE